MFWRNYILLKKKKKVDPFFTLYTKLISYGIIVLNTMKIFGSKYLHDLGVENFFLNNTSGAKHKRKDLIAQFFVIKEILFLKKWIPLKWKAIHLLGEDICNNYIQQMTHSE